MKALQLLLCLQLLLLLGCAQKVDDINRVQPGLLDKEIFQGDWLMRRTVIDAPYDTGFTFIGEQDEASRIHWEIQEKLLIAWRALPMIDGTQDAAPMAVFAIETHADVKRDYNAATGEQTNVLLENTEDRPWYERDYIRVDWSKNLVTNFHFYVEGLDQDPVAYFVEEDGNENRVLLGVINEEGEWADEQDAFAQQEIGEAQYLDVVTKVFVEPEQWAWEDWWGDIVIEPPCWYYGNYDCAPMVLTVRNSFLRLDAVDTGYTPLAFPDNQVARSADGDPIRVAWNEEGDLKQTASPTDNPNDDTGGASQGGDSPTDPYAGGDGSVVRLDFFDKFGFFRTERFGYDPLYAEVEGKRIYWINRYNIWKNTTDVDGNALPYKDREVRPIVYYLSPDFPADLMPAAQATADQWNEAFQDTVQTLTGWDEVPTMVELRVNTREVDSETGEITNRGQQNGDLRYSHIYLVSQPTRVGLLGYGPSAIDPLTGEVISSTAYIYGAAVNEVAAKGRDVIDLINGKIDPEDLALGEHVAGYLDKLAGGGTQSAAKSAEQVRDFARSHQSAPPASGNHKGTGGKSKNFRKPTASQTAKKPGLQKFKRPKGWATARLHAIQGSPIEDLLMGDPAILAMKGGSHIQPGMSAAALPPGLKNQVSPVQWASPDHHRVSLARMRGFSKRNMLMVPFVDDAVAGLALELVDDDSADVLQILRSAIFKSTAEHEVGHTLGLRHNFEASTDALNFPSQYWTLRGDSHTPLAPMTDAEKQGKLKQYHYSSIMDYHGRFNTDISGIGHYDRAAIKFGYGQLVEVFDNAPSDKLLALQDWEDGTYTREFDLDTVLRKWRHYSKIPTIFGSTAGIEARHDVPYTSGTAALMGMAPEDSYVAQLTGDVPWSSWEVPYRFCSDEYVFGTATCDMFDLGVDPAEIVADTVERYWNYYWFNNFKRERILFDEYDYMDSMWWRYFAPIKNLHDHWVFQQWYDADTWEWMRYDADIWGIEDIPWAEAGDGGLTSSAAAMDGLTFMVQVLSTPGPGAYWYDFEESYWWALDTQPMVLCEEEWSWDSEYWCADFNMSLGDGRYFESIYDVDSGYYFYERMKWVGSFYDKLAALEALTSPDTYFLGIDTSASLDQWAISMYGSFPKEMQQILSGVAADWFFLFAGTFTDDGAYLPPNPFAKGAELAVYEEGGPVDPQTSFTVQLYALWYGMAWLNANFDNSFNDGAKIWLKGSGEAFEPVDPDPDLVVEFANPFNNRTYVASWPTDPDIFGVGATMVSETVYWYDIYTEALEDPDMDADTLDYYKWRVSNMVENIEVVRGLYDLYGYMYF